MLGVVSRDEVIESSKAVAIELWEDVDEIDTLGPSQGECSGGLSPGSILVWSIVKL